MPTIKKRLQRGGGLTYLCDGKEITQEQYDLLKASTRPQPDTPTTPDPAPVAEESQKQHSFCNIM